MFKSLALRIVNYTGKYKPQVHNVLHNLLICVNEPLQNTNKLHTLAHRVSLSDTIEEATAKVCAVIYVTPTFRRACVTRGSRPASETKVDTHPMFASVCTVQGL